jgi:hypothetical protein
LLKVKTAADIPRRLREVRAVREIAAAASALSAYVTTVLPKVRKELKELGPLPEEKAKNAEAVAVFATLAPRHRRGAVVRAILALQVAIDLRDELEEGEEGIDRRRLDPLESRWRREVAALPSYQAVRPHLEAAIQRCEQGQQHTHRAAGEDSTALRTWAKGLPAPDGYRWWEVAAGASSSVAAHALIALAADPEADVAAAARIVAAYYPPIGALTVLLDDFVDQGADRKAGEHSYLSYYDGAEEVTERLGIIARRAADRLEQLPQASRHQAILSGVAAFYSSPAPVGPGAEVLAAFVRLRQLTRRRSRPPRGQ